MNRSTIILEIGGENFSGWKKFDAEFDMESLSTTFSLDLYDRERVFARSFETGFPCNVFVSNPDLGGVEERLVNGFITSTSRSIAENANTLSVSGADKLVDIVDCSAIYESQTWTEKRFSSIIIDLLAPYNVGVDRSALGANDPVIEKFAVQSGETAFQAVERLCRSQAVLPLSTFDGDLLLGYAAGPEQRASVDLEVGVNVEKLSESIDWGERFSTYVALGQYPGKGGKWSKEILQARSVANDAGVTRYRPKMFIAESKADRDILAKRVAWEAQIRSGRATEYSATVSGWYQMKQGRPLRLWQKNERVNLRFDAWGVNLERLITRVGFSLSENGEQTTLTLKHPDIFKPDPGEEVDLT